MWNKEWAVFSKGFAAPIGRTGFISTLPWDDVRGIVHPLFQIVGQNPMLEPRSVHLTIKTNDEVRLDHITDGENVLWLLSMQI